MQNAIPLCPSCARANAAEAHFCAACGAPLTAAATTDSLASVFAEGFAARRAITQTGKPIIFVGVCLWMVPLAVAGFIGLLFSVNELLKGLHQGDAGSLFAGLLAGMFSVVFLYIAGAMLYRVTRNQSRAPGSTRPDATHQTENPSEAEIAADGEPSACLACGKPMSLSAVECTECGWSYAENESET